jgi:hypothetical protein
MPIFTVRSPFPLLVETVILKVLGRYAPVPLQDWETAYPVPLGIFPFLKERVIQRLNPGYEMLKVCLAKPIRNQRGANQ